MSREDPPLRIRLPADLKAQVADAAKANRRSMNAEIVARLEASFIEAIAPLSGLGKMHAAAKGNSIANLEREFAELKATVQTLASRVDGICR